MKASLVVFLTAFSFASAVAASDVVQHAPNHQNTLKTSRDAECSTPTSKLSKQCTKTPGTQVSSAQRF